MNKWLVRAAMAGSLLSQSNVVWGQAAVVDLQNLKPREVRSTVFTLATPQDVRVEAVGAESGNDGGTFSWVASMWSGKEDRRDPWMGNAWILDLRTRKVVWELSASPTQRGRRETRVFSGTIKLPAGDYEAFYSAFPTMSWSDADGNQNTAQRFMTWLTDQGFDDFRLTIHGNAQVLAGAAAAHARTAYANGALVAFHGDGSGRYLQAGFALERATEIEIYVVGEAREDAAFDSGWLINADTHEKIWQLTWRDSSPAGGAQKNRMARFTRTLPPGRYAAFYATDDSHDAREWNAPPPHDPEAWGLLLRVADPASRAAVKSFPYEHVPAAATIVALTRVGDGESRSRGFTLNRAMDVRIYALGEGRDGRMFDYGWITRGTTHQKVWEMRYAETEHAGGDAKNRLVDKRIHLDAGNYVLHYVTDDSHSADGFNASAPPDGRRWGVTLLAAGGAVERGAVSEYAEQPDVNVIAQIVGVRDDERPRKTFALDRQTDVRVYALGEATSSRGMADYGWIEDAKTGRTVWEMTYRTTEPAGGAAKNRRFDGTITLPAGEYRLRYETDDSHAFGSWNANPPDEPDMYGITVYRVR
jgi:hypothetical protein